MHNRDILKWKEDDKVFIETPNFPAMLQQVREQSFVTLVGVPGSGKSATAQHIALKLETEGYNILPVRDIRDIETYCDPHHPQVFVIDDVLGVFRLDMSLYNMLNKYKDRINNPAMPETKTILTCRKVVFRNKTLSNTFFSNQENIIQMNSDDNILTDEDKHRILAKYNLEKNVLTDQSMPLTSKVFLYLCNFFSKIQTSKTFGADVFISPIPCILEELDNMQRRNAVQYASLVLMIVNRNELSEKSFDHEKDMNKPTQFLEAKREILAKCKVSCSTDSFEFIDALSEMEGTFTRKCDSHFTFIHDSMFEILAYHFGCQFPELILRYISSDYIANYIKVGVGDVNKTEMGKEEDTRKVNNTTKKDRKKERVFDLCIILKESEYEQFVTRMILDLENGELYNVFRNDALKHPAVLQAFTRMMERKTFAELHSLFLSQLHKTFKIRNDEFTKYEIDVWHSYFICDFLLSEKTIQGHTRNCVRAIKWVIYHGHYEILQYIINRIIKQKGKVDDLFNNSYNERDLQVSDRGDTCTQNTRHHCMSYDETLGTVKRKCTGDSDTDDDSDTDIECKFNSEPLIVEQCRLLCLGCYSGDLNTVQILLKHIQKDIIFNASHLEILHLQNMPLLIASEFGHLSMAIMLLENGADLNPSDELKTPLTASCGKGYLSVVRELIKAGADVNLTDKNKTPLTTACSGGYQEIVQELIHERADVNLKDKNNTPLTAACEGGHVSVVEILIKAGANVNLRDGEKTPLTAACNSGRHDVVKRLIKAKAEVNQKDKDRTPLTAVCMLGYINIVQTLISAGASVNQKDSKTPLTASCFEGHLNIVKLLITAKADINLKDEHETPLMVACWRGNLTLIDELIKSGADVNVGDEEKTPLTAACFRGQLNIAEKLIKAGAAVNLKDKDTTPLITACKMGHLSVTKILLKAGADILICDGFNSPITAASCEGHICVVTELIKAGASVNSFYCGETPLLVACQRQHESVANELIKAGADVNLGDEKQTPITTACFFGTVKFS